MKLLRPAFASFACVLAVALVAACGGSGTSVTATVTVTTSEPDTPAEAVPTEAVATEPIDEAPTEPSDEVVNCLLESESAHVLADNSSTGGPVKVSFDPAQVNLYLGEAAVSADDPEALAEFSGDGLYEAWLVEPTDENLTTLDGCYAEAGMAAPDRSIPEAPPAPTEAEVVVVKSGFTQSDSNLGYGLVLQNPSPSDDALDVTITVNVLGDDELILATDSQSINVIPASTRRFYVGGETALAEGENAAGLEIIVDIGSTASAAYPLPSVSNVRAQINEFGRLTVRGQVENNLDAPLSPLARIGIVLFGRGGKVIGGGFTYLLAPLPPGRRAAFNTALFATPSETIVRAEASIDNEVQ